MSKNDLDDDVLVDPPAAEDDAFVYDNEIGEMGEDGPIVFGIDDDDPEDAPTVIGTVTAEEALPEGHRSGFVALVGQPNVGKSTLLNAFMQQKLAIVSPRPQTTRNKQLGISTHPDHQIVFVDTPGIMQKALHKLDEVMLESAVDTLNDADVVVWLVDAGYPPNAGDETIAEIVRKARGHVILALNKNDLVPPDDVLERIDAYRTLLPEEAQWFFLSASAGRGVEELYEAIVAALPEGPRYYPADQITETFLRDIVAEMIREQILLQIRDEIPHGTTVKIDQFKEDEIPLYVRATIFVEKESHKPIIIGSGGRQLKAIGAAARQEIQNMLGERIYLDLWVKSAPKWRRKENQLKRFGYLE